MRRVWRRGESGQATTEHLGVVVAAVVLVIALIAGVRAFSPTMFDTLACNLGRIVNPDSACPVATAEDQTSGGLDTGAPQGGDALAGVSQPWYCCIR